MNSQILLPRSFSNQIHITLFANIFYINGSLNLCLCVCAILRMCAHTFTFCGLSKWLFRVYY